MTSVRIANRYAEALMTTAEESHILKNVSDDLVLIQRILLESREFQLFLKSPVIKAEKKHQVFTTTFKNSVQPLTLEFLFFILRKGREDTLQSIIEAFFRLQDESLGIINVHVTSAAGLSKEQTDRLEQHFEALSKMKVRMAMEVDAKLIGGFVARIGDTVFDGSVKRQLELLHQRFIVESKVS
jgi:F-type H+-transporting ATPase subunit delta